MTVQKISYRKMLRSESIFILSKEYGLYFMFNGDVLHLFFFLTLKIESYRDGRNGRDSTGEKALDFHIIEPAWIPSTTYVLHSTARGHSEHQARNNFRELVHVLLPTSQLVF